MKIAELFVDLDIKGAVAVKNALGSVQDGLGKTAEMSMATKAGILGALLGLEEITRGAIGSAVELKNFAGATGLSTVELQKWLYLAKMNDVAGEELAGTIKGLQSAQAAMALGKGVPEGAVWFGLDPKKNPLEMFGQIQQKLRQVGNDQKQIGIARSMASTLGISDDMFAMLRAGNLSLAGFRQEMLLTGKEQKNLIGVNRAWKQFWYDLNNQSQKTIGGDLAGPITGFVKFMDDAVKGLGDTIKVMHTLMASANFDSKTFGENFKMIGLAIAAGLAPLAPYTAALIALSTVLSYVHDHKPDEIDTKNRDRVKGGFEKGGWSGIKELLRPMDDDTYRRAAGLPAGTDVRTNWQVMSDWFGGVMKGSQPVPMGSAQGQQIMNHVEVNVPPGTERGIPEQTAHAVTKALGKLNGGQ